MQRMGVVASLFVLSTFVAFAQLTIDAPAGGEIFYTNRTTEITVRWSGVDDTTKVQLEWSTDGRNWNMIADSLTGLSYLWDISGLSISSAYRVRVSQVRTPQGTDNVVYTGHENDVADAVFSPGDERVVSVGTETHIWNSSVGGSTPNNRLPGPNATFASCAWSADSTLIASGADDGGVRVYETAGNTLQGTLNHPMGVTSVSFGALDNLILTQCDDNRARLFRPPGTVAVGTYNPAAQIQRVVFSPDGRRILVCANDARIYPVSGGLPLNFGLHTAGVLDGAWSPDGSLICTAGGDATIRLWDAVTASERWSGSDPREGVRCVAFSHDGKRVAVGMSDSTITIWDVSTGAMLQKIGGHTSAIRMVNFTPDDSRLASASDDNTARVYVFADNFSTTYPHQNDVHVARWSSDGTRLLTSSRDRTAVVWRVREITLQADTSNIFSIAAPPPAFAQFYATGDTIDVGETTVISVSLRGASGLDLADIDSVAFTMDYNASMLHLIESSVAVVGSTDSSNMKRVSLSAVPLPLTDAQLLTVTFRGTLGADSISAFRFRRVDQIGSGPGAQVTTQSDPILIRGICREGGIARLYNPVGTNLQIIERNLGGSAHIEVTLAESGPTAIRVYNTLGDLLFSDVATSSEEQQRFLQRTLPRSLIGTYAFVVVTTSTQSLSKIIGTKASR